MDVNTESIFEVTDAGLTNRIVYWQAERHNLVRNDQTESGELFISVFWAFGDVEEDGDTVYCRDALQVLW